MKKLIVVLLCTFALQAYSQPFEGTVTWSALGKDAGSSITLHVKGTTLVSIINGGMMNGTEMWFMNNDTKIMRIMRPQKMFVVVPPEAIAAAAKASETSVFTKTGETTKILTYTCTKYTGQMKVRGVVTKVAIWTTTEIKDDLKVLAHQPDPFSNPRLPEGVEGIPLKIENITDNGTSVMQVTELKVVKLSDELFTLPADFKEAGK